MDDDDLEFHETVITTPGKNYGKDVRVVRCVRCGGQTEEVVE